MHNESTDPRFSRRAALRRAAIAGGVGWVAPVVLTSSPAAAGVFTAKCAPSAVTATAGFVQTGCTAFNSTIRITISFNGTCPCGGTALWCVQKNSPSPSVSGTSSVFVFSVTISVFTTVTIRGKVALGCTDRDGDTQYAVYDWVMTATDNGSACSVANSISGVTLSNRTLVTQSACPSLASLAPLSLPPAAPPGARRQE